ncbi:MAG: hypothetical protein IIB28_06980, partial [Chloroflexi bacterium]|nr:hypothetical protein [Chloroflexota bacterium]
AASIVAALILARTSTVERRGIKDFRAAGGGISLAEARDRAFEEAEAYGIEGTPDVWIARQINFGQYAELAGESTKSIFGTPDYSPSAVVWVVSMRGNVTGPLLGAEVINFDNLTIVLDAVSGERLHIETFFEDFESNLKIPISYDPAESCDKKDRGDLLKIFRSTCPYPDDPGSGAEDR